MALFKRKQRWEQTFRLQGNVGPVRGFLTVLFWFWGVGGLLFNAGTLFGLTGSIGVGTSAYLSATCLVWIGGMVLFGVGALLSQPDFDGERPLDDPYEGVRITE